MLRDEGSYWASDRGQQALRWPFETVWRRLGSNAPLMALWRKFWGLKANTAKFSTKRWRTRPKNVFFFRFGVCLPRLVQKPRLSVFSAFRPINSAFAPGNGGGTGGNGGERGGNGGERGGTGGNGGGNGGGTGAGTGGNGGILGSGLGQRCFGGNCPKKQNTSETSWFVPNFTKKSSNCREFRETFSKLGEKREKHQNAITSLKHVGMGEIFDRNIQTQTFLSKKGGVCILHWWVWFQAWEKRH